MPPRGRKQHPGGGRQNHHHHGNQQHFNGNMGEGGMPSHMMHQQHQQRHHGGQMGQHSNNNNHHHGNNSQHHHPGNAHHNHHSGRGGGPAHFQQRSQSQSHHSIGQAPGYHHQQHNSSRGDGFMGKGDSSHTMGSHNPHQNMGGGPVVGNAFGSQNLAAASQPTVMAPEAQKRPMQQPSIGNQQTNSTQIMGISKYLEQFPQLEEECKVMFRQKFEEVMGKAPMPQIEEYVLTIGIKCDSPRETVFENFQVLFQEKTDQIVKLLFESIAPRITQAAMLLQQQNVGAGAASEDPQNTNQSQQIVKSDSTAQKNPEDGNILGGAGAVMQGKPGGEGARNQNNQPQSHQQSFHSDHHARPENGPQNPNFRRGGGPNNIQQNSGNVGRYGGDQSQQAPYGGQKPHPQQQQNNSNRFMGNNDGNQQSFYGGRGSGAPDGMRGGRHGGPPTGRGGGGMGGNSNQFSIGGPHQQMQQSQFRGGAEGGKRMGPNNSQSQGQGQQSTQFLQGQLAMGGNNSKVHGNNMGGHQRMNESGGGSDQQPGSFGGQQGQICQCKHMQFRMMQQAGNPNQARRMNKMIGKSCFKCGGVITAPGQTPAGNGNSGAMGGGPPGRLGNLSGNQFQQRDGAPPNSQMQKKRIRPEDLDCELDSIIRRDSNVSGSNNSKGAPYDPSKRQKRGNPGQGMGPGFGEEDGNNSNQMGKFGGNNFNKHGQQQRKQSFEQNGMPFGAKNNKRGGEQGGNFNNKYGMQSQGRHGPPMGGDGMPTGGDMNRGRPPMGGYAKGGQQFGNNRDGPGMGFNRNHSQHKMGFNKHGDSSYGGGPHSQFNSMHGQNSGGHQSGVNPREPQQFVEPEMPAEQAEELRRKRLERFGPVEPVEPFQATAKDGGVSKSQSDKVQVRCKHWPNCRQTAAQCEYVHPKEECKFFPKCSYGDKCLFLHPEIVCKFGDSCTRLNCAYKHSRNHRAQNMMYGKPWLMMMAQGMMQNPNMFINNFNAGAGQHAGKKESAQPQETQSTPKPDEQ